MPGFLPYRYQVKHLQILRYSYNYSMYEYLIYRTVRIP